MQALQVANYIYVALSYIAAAAFILWLYLFCRLRNEDWIRKRRPILVIVFGISLIIEFTVERVTVILWSQSECCHTPFEGWKAIQVLLITFIGTGCYWIVVARVWLVYFDIKFNLALQQNQWKSHIDPNSPKTNWFLKHRTTFGSVKWTSIYCLGWVSLLTAVDTIDVWIAGRYNKRERAVIAASCILAGVHIILVLWKLPRYTDVFSIRAEVYPLAVSAVVGGVVWALVFVFAMPQPPSWGYLFYMASFSFNLLAFGLISFPISLYKGGLPLSPQALNNYFLPENVRKRCASGFNLLQNRDRKANLFVKLDTFLSTHSGFTLYAQHLCDEFSIENLLFLLETAQFLEKLISTIASKTCIDASKMKQTKRELRELCTVEIVRFPLRKLPRSQIVSYNTGSRSAAGSLSSPLTHTGAETASEAAAAAVVVTNPILSNTNGNSNSNNDVESLHVEHAIQLSHISSAAGGASSKSEEDGSIVIVPDHSPNDPDPALQIVYTDSTVAVGGSAAAGAVAVHKSSDITNRTASGSVHVTMHNDVWQQVVLLFEKYIAPNTTFEVNVSSRARSHLYTAFHFGYGGYQSVFGSSDKRSVDSLLGFENGATILCESNQGDLTQLLTIFDESRTEVWRLMRDSYTRFKKTEPYRTWCEKHGSRIQEAKINSEAPLPALPNRGP